MAQTSQSPAANGARQQLSNFPERSASASTATAAPTQAADLAAQIQTPDIRNGEPPPPGDQPVPTNPKTFLERDDWMRALNASGLPPAVRCLAIGIALHANIKTGQCDPGHKTLFKETGISKRSINRFIGRLERAGWLAVKRNGRGNNASYVLLRCAKAMAHHAPMMRQTVHDDAPLLAHLEQRRTTPLGRPQAPPGVGERETPRRRGASISPGAAGALTAPRPKSGKEGSKEGSAAEAGEARKQAFAALREVYDRGHLDDPEPDRLAYERAIARGADHDEIMAAARATVAAADEPRFLKPLWKWLDREGYLKPPSAKRPSRRNSAAPQARNGRRNGHKVDLTRLALKIGGYQEDADGNLFWPGEGAVQ